jgi:hypothetical protein
VHVRRTKALSNVVCSKLEAGWTLNDAMEAVDRNFRSDRHLLAAVLPYVVRRHDSFRLFN